MKGEDLEGVEYHLDDPESFRDETIVVVGAGDSAIENAIALARQNDVYIVNRRGEFSRAKDGNLAAVLAASSDPDNRLKVLYKTQPQEIRPGDKKRLLVILETETGPLEIAADRIIGRLGAIPPRTFVEAAGVQFPNAKPEAIPELSRQYESNVAGLYIIGSLAGYPLIKQAMNQGYDVIEFINGNSIRPADHPLLDVSIPRSAVPERRRRADGSVPEAHSDVPSDERARISRADHREQFDCELFTRARRSKTPKSGCAR